MNTLFGFNPGASPSFAVRTVLLAAVLFVALAVQDGPRAQTLPEPPAASGGNPEGAWAADATALQVYAAPELAVLTASLTFGGTGSGNLSLEADGSYEADYIVNASVVGTLGLIPVDVVISDTARSTGTYATFDSLLVLSGSEGFLDSLLFTAEDDTLRLIQEVPLGAYAATVQLLAPGAPAPLSVLRLSRVESGGDTVPSGAAAADYDASGKVDFDDFLEFVGHFGARRGDPNYGAPYDLTADGRIDFDDFLEFVSYFGMRIPASQ